MKSRQPPLFGDSSISRRRPIYFSLFQSHCTVGEIILHFRRITYVQSHVYLKNMHKLLILEKMLWILNLDWGLSSFKAFLSISQTLNKCIYLQNQSLVPHCEIHRPFILPFGTTGIWLYLKHMIQCNICKRTIDNRQPEFATTVWKHISFQDWVRWSVF